MKRQHHLMLLSPTLPDPIASSSGWESSSNARGPVPPCHCCYQGCSSGSHVGFPIKTRTGISGVSTASPLPSSEESKTQPIWQPALSFRNKLSRLERWERPAGFFPTSPVTEQLAEALREQICSAATGQVATMQSLFGTSPASGVLGEE